MPSIALATAQVALAGHSSDAAGSHPCIRRVLPVQDWGCARGGSPSGGPRPLLLCLHICGWLSVPSGAQLPAGAGVHQAAGPEQAPGATSQREAPEQPGRRLVRGVPAAPAGEPLISSEGAADTEWATVARLALACHVCGPHINVQLSAYTLLFLHKRLSWPLVSEVMLSLSAE